MLDDWMHLLVAINLLMNENPTASKTFLRPSAPISLELTSFATCKDGQIDEIQAVMGFWSPRHRLLFTIIVNYY